jgi:hypothetical protein
MNIGITPYLENIVSSLIASIQDKSQFGNYQVSVAFVAGELLYHWFNASNVAYSTFIWAQFQAILRSQIYKKQIKTNIVLTKRNIRDNILFGYKFLQQDKYQQVFNKSFCLNIGCHYGPDAELYYDSGDSYERIPYKEIKGCIFWSVLLTKGGQDTISSAGLKKKFYLRFRRDSKNYLSRDTQKISYTARKKPKDYFNSSNIYVLIKVIYHLRFDRRGSHE